MNFWRQVAEEAYKAYAKTTNNKNYQGNEMPLFHELPEQIRDAWIAASSRSVKFCVEQHLNGLDWGGEYREGVRRA